MKISINTSHVNKMPDDLSGDELKSWWRTFNGSFENFDIPSVDILIDAINNGYAYTTQHIGYRKADNFKCGQHIGLDFDTGDYRSSVEGILKDPFIQANASFIHSTASHTYYAPRSRVIFILEREIYTVNKYKLLAEAFAETYKTNGAADPSCKDPVRIFFGALNCSVYKLGHTLTLEKAAEIVLPYKDSLRKNSNHITPDYGPSNIDHEFLIDRMVDKLLSAPDGSKWHVLGRVAREGGGYVGAGYFDEEYIFNRLYQAIAARQSTRDLRVAEERILWGLSVGQTEPLYLEEDLDPVISRMFR